jgi:type I restriction enzyme S subunit
MIPKLRFPEFRDKEEWDVTTFDKIYSFYVTNSFSRDELTYQKGTVKNIHYGDIHTKFSTLFDIKNEKVPFINPLIEIKKIPSESYCIEGDMIFADASEDLKDVGKSIEIVNINHEKLVSGLHTILARQIQKKLIVGFGGYLFKSDWIRTQIQKEAQGAKVLGISAKRLSTINIAYPTNHLEQQKIASTLSSLDDLITAQSEKIKALQAHKKSLMQQLFPAEGERVPRLRFPEFWGAGDWDFFNGDKVFDQISNKNHNSDLPILAITQEYGAVPRNQIDYHVIVTEKSVESYKVVEVGDFIISLRSFQGGIEYSNHQGICSPAYVILRNKIEIEQMYFKYYFKTEFFIQNLSKNIEGIRDGKMVTYKQFSELFLPIPSIFEQQKIAATLFSLDDLIKTQNQKLEALKKHKKGLMQQLFPNPIEETV